MNISDLVSALGLKNIDSYGGVNPYGGRWADTPSEPLSVKGLGYFGALPNKSGNISTELSASNEKFSFPLLVPTLTEAEIKHLLSGKYPTEDIYKKAEDYANYRISNGMDPFAQPSDIRIPVGLLDIFK